MTGQTLAAAFSLALPILVPGLVLIASLKLGWFSGLDSPVDRGAAWRGRPLLGKNKTWRGVVIYVVGGALVAAVLASAAGDGWASHLFGEVNPIALGAGAGAAYSLAEIVNSFVKRRLAIPAGQTVATRWAGVQRAVDLVDGIVAVSVFYLALGAPWVEVATLAIMAVGIHLSTDVLMRALRLKHRQ